MTNHKTFKIALSSFLIVIVSTILINSIFLRGNESLTVKESNEVSKTDSMKVNENTKESAEDRDAEYYEGMGNQHRFLSQEQNQQTWKEVLSMQSDIGMKDAPVNSWKCIGPYGVRRSSSSELYSGRILDIEVEGVPYTRVASASGGLWSFNLVFPVPLSDGITSLVIGSFATNPGDANTIILGTGEPYGTGGSGTGLWKTTNGGITWAKKDLTPGPGSFYKVRYRPGNNSIIYAASNTGLYRSVNGGESWQLRAAGNITDLAMNPVHPNTMYIAKYGDGLYKSINGGNDFFKVTIFPVGASEFGRASISICNLNPDYVYINLSNQIGGGQTKGIYRTSNEGISWHDISFTPGDYHWNQGNYNNCIAVSPTNPNVVLLGAGSLLRTTNGGTNWTQYMEGDPGVENFHNDFHIIRWHSDGIRVWVGNDGGMAYSDDLGLTWNVSANMLPITQFYDFDIGISGNNITIAGGTQDNAFPVALDCTINSSGIWNRKLGGDAASSKVDRFNPLRIMGVYFDASGNWLGKTINGFVSTSSGMTGLNSSVHISNIEDNGVSPIVCYIGHGDKIYYSNDFGDSWHPFTQTQFPSTVWRINVSKFGPDGIIIYAVLNNGSDYLRVFDAGSWQNRSAGLTSPLRYVAQHPSNNHIAYAITDGISPSHEIFKTSNRGANWINISGDLPDIQMTDLVVHPINDNILFAGSDGFGMWKTSNGGANWFRWINGMPQANKISRLKVIDSTATVGRFYIVTATFGRGIWIREGSGDEPLPIITIIHEKLELLKHKVDTLVITQILPPQFGGMLNNNLLAANNELNQGHNQVALFKMWLFKFEVNLLIQLQILPQQYGQSLVIGANDVIDLIEDLHEHHNIVIPNVQNKSFSLSQNYPNPFNPSTKIKFEIPFGSFVTLKVYDILGKQVASLVNEDLSEGLHEVEWNASSYASGIYFYKLNAQIDGQKFERTMKMILLK